MSKPTHHTLDIYDVDLHLATDRRAWSTLRRTLPFLDGPPKSLGLATFATWVPKDRPALARAHVVIWINRADHPDLLQVIDTCAHEATHAASSVFDWMGHQIGHSDEPHAYLVGWLTRWIFEHLDWTDGTPA